jgi:hypothetical protein
MAWLHAAGSATAKPAERARLRTVDGIGRQRGGDCRCWDPLPEETGKQKVILRHSKPAHGRKEQRAGRIGRLLVDDPSDLVQGSRDMAGTALAGNLHHSLT